MAPLNIAQPAAGVKIKSVRRVKLENPVPVYDATVPKYHNYMLGNGVVVHNTGKQARDVRYQELLAIRGKIINAYGPSGGKIFDNEEVLDILRSIGYSGNEKTPDKLNLRVGKIMVLTDPDHDGKHISLLLLNLLQRVLPKAIAEKMVYVVDAPLFMYSLRDKKYFGNTLEELKKTVPNGKIDADKVTRIKGWGEVNPPVLRQLAFDPKTRKLIRVTELQKEQTTKFIEIVGEQAHGRRQLLGL